MRPAKSNLIGVVLSLLVSGHFAVATLTTPVAKSTTPDPQANYTLHAVMRILNPVDITAMNDGRQIAKVVRATDEYTDVSVILFPLLNPQVKSDPDWRRNDADMAEYTRPELTENWDNSMRQELVAALASDGIDVSKLDDKTLVTKVSDWLLHHSKTLDIFDTWFVDFSSGQARVLPGLESAFVSPRNLGDPSWTPQDQFAHELLGRSMFSDRCHGSCTSYAIYQATALRALGIPTRIFLTIPLADANDPGQIDGISNSIHHHLVRATILHGLERLGGGFSNHTFNEVYVGGQWTPLNYNVLGQPMLSSDYAGLFVHIASLNDWSDSKYAATWGTRYALGTRSAALPTANPYGLLQLTDEFGSRANIPNPDVTDLIPKTVTVSRLYWQTDPNRPAVVGPPMNPSAGHLVLHVTDENLSKDYKLLKGFMQRAGRDFFMTADGASPIKARITLANWTDANNAVCEAGLEISPADFAQMTVGLRYTLTAPQSAGGYVWKLTRPLTVVKPVGPSAGPTDANLVGSQDPPSPTPPLESRGIAAVLETAGRDARVANTDFPYEVNFVLGVGGAPTPGQSDIYTAGSGIPTHINLIDSAHDNISISGVRGTSPRIEVDGHYQVTGTYSLSRSETGRIGAFVTESGPQGRESSSSDENQVSNIKRGEGKFTLEFAVPAAGWPHVSIYPAGAGNAEYVLYFGTGDTVNRQAPLDSIVDVLH